MSIIERMSQKEFIRKVPDYKSWEMHIADEHHPSKLTLNEDNTEIKIVTSKGMTSVEETYKLSRMNFYRNKYTKSLVGKINGTKWIEGYND